MPRESKVDRVGKCSPKLVQYLSYGSRTVQPPIMSTLLIFYQFNRPWKSFLWVLSLQFPRFLGSLSLHPWKSSYCRPFCRVLLTGLPRVSRAVRPAERSDKGRRGRHKVRPGVTHSPRATPDRSHVLRTGPGPWHEWDGEWVAIKITFVELILFTLIICCLPTAFGLPTPFRTRREPQATKGRKGRWEDDEPRERITPYKIYLIYQEAVVTQRILVWCLKEMYNVQRIIIKEVFERVKQIIK